MKETLIELTLTVVALLIGFAIGKQIKWLLSRVGVPITTGDPIPMPLNPPNA